MVLRKCHKCNADMKKEKTETTIGWGDYEIVVRGIEAHAWFGDALEGYLEEDPIIFDNINMVLLIITVK